MFQNSRQRLHFRQRTLASAGQPQAFMNQLSIQKTSLKNFYGSPQKLPLAFFQKPHKSFFCLIREKIQHTANPLSFQKTIGGLSADLKYRNTRNAIFRQLDFPPVFINNLIINNKTYCRFHADSGQLLVKLFFSFQAGKCRNNRNDSMSKGF